MKVVAANSGTVVLMALPELKSDFWRFHDIANSDY